MKETIVWVSSVLEEIKNQITQINSNPSITLPLEENSQDCFLVVNFRIGKKWFGFGITENDLKLNPEELVSQVKSDLELDKNG